MNTIETAQKEIEKAIVAYVRKAKKNGTRSMSMENLFQCVPTVPTANRAFAGANGRYFYRQEFFNIAGRVAGSFVF